MSSVKTSDTQALSSASDKVVNRLHQVDEKINALSAQRLADQETVGDKFFKMAFPSLAGMAAGKIFQSIWNSVTAKVHPSVEDDEQDRQQGLLMSIIFAAASAAFVAVITQLSDRGSQALVQKLQKRRIKKNF